MSTVRSLVAIHGSNLQETVQVPKSEITARCSRDWGLLEHYHGCLRRCTSYALAAPTEGHKKTANRINRDFWSRIIVG
jgi:hypothetical protein